MSLLEIKNLKKSFDKNEVLKDISLKVDKGEVLCIIGPSGSGKSTLLRCITGLETKDSGIIDFDGTIAEEAFPGIGKLKNGAKECINSFYDLGFNVLINTCRTGSYEGDCENFLRRHKIKIVHFFYT